MDDTSDASSFTYSALAAVDADWLKEVALTLRVRLRHTVASLLDAGSMLAKARRRLGRDQWPKWLAKEAQVPARSAARLIAVANVFGSVQPEVLERRTPTALYVLSEPGTPQSLREYVIEQAKDGEQITATIVQEWLVAYRDSPTAPLKLARKDEKPTAFDSDEIHAGENWRLLNELLGKDGSVHFAASTDAEESIADKWIIGIFTKPATQTEPAIRRTATHNNLERVLLTLCGTIRQKECPRCGKTKSLDEFSKRKDREDGRNSYCLGCERGRVKEYERKKRERVKMAG